MKSGNFINFLAIIAVIACFVTPVMADQNITVDQAVTLYNRAEELLSSKDYQDAVTIYDQALASNLTNIKMGDGLLYLYRDKSYALIQLNRTDDALQTINDGLSLYGNDAMLWNNKGYVLASQGKYQDALNSYNNALTYAPTGMANELIDNGTIVQILNNKGDLLYKTGQFQGAVDAYTQALSINPGNSYSTNGLALAKNAAASMVSSMIIIIVIVLIGVAGAGTWYFKFRKPAEENPAETKKVRKGKK
jgi:tetratricopeptide (TPR) repeat protein